MLATVLATAVVSTLYWERQDTQFVNLSHSGDFSRHAVAWDPVFTNPLDPGRILVYDNGVLLEARQNKVTPPIGTWVWKIVEPATSTRPPPRHSMVYGTFGLYTDGRQPDPDAGLIIALGEGPGRVFYNDIWRFNFARNQWFRLDDPAKEAPEPRYAASGGMWVNSQTGVSGLRFTHGFSSVRFSDAWNFDFASRLWQRERKDDINEYTTEQPHPRCLAPGNTNPAGELFMMGGCLSGGETGGPCPSHDSWCRKTDLTWEEITNGRPTPRVKGLMIPFPPAPETMLMIGGTNNIGDQWLHGAEPKGEEVAAVNCADREWTFYVPEGGGPPNFFDGAAVARPAKANQNDGDILVVGGRGMPGNGAIWILYWESLNLKGTPETGDSDTYLTLPMLHGIFMFFGWGLFCNVGVFAARYLRFLGPAWFAMHQGCMVFGYVMALVGFFLIIPGVSNKHFMFAHGGLGLGIMILATFQPILGVLRPERAPVGQAATGIRAVWEKAHTFIGMTSLLMANINIVLGVLIIIAPLGVIVAASVWCGVWALLWIIMEVSNRAQHGSNWQRVVELAAQPESTGPVKSAPDADSEDKVDKADEPEEEGSMSL